MTWLEKWLDLKGTEKLFRAAKMISNSVLSIWKFSFHEITVFQIEKSTRKGQKDEVLYFQTP